MHPSTNIPFKPVDCATANTIPWTTIPQDNIKGNVSGDLIQLNADAL